MSGTVLIKHPVLGAVSEVPASSIPQWRQAGWEPLTPEELAERERAVAKESEEAERWLRSFSGADTDESAPPSSDVQSSSNDADERPAEEENG